jgi:hypothetical protein
MADPLNRPTIDLVSNEENRKLFFSIMAGGNDKRTAAAEKFLENGDWGTLASIAEMTSVQGPKSSEIKEWWNGFKADKVTEVARSLNVKKFELENLYRALSSRDPPRDSKSIIEGKGRWKLFLEMESHPTMMPLLLQEIKRMEREEFKQKSSFLGMFRNRSNAEEAIPAAKASKKA